MDALQTQTVNSTTAPQPNYIPGLIAVVGCDDHRPREIAATTLANRAALSGAALGRRRRQNQTIAVGWRLARKATGGQIIENPKHENPKHENQISSAMGGGDYVLLLRRMANLRKVQRLAQSGVLVVSDRFPQAEISGFYYDGPGIGVERATGKISMFLAQRERRLYQKMAQSRPELIIRLGIDIDTAISRKPDHDYAELQDKIGVMSTIGYNGTKILEIDSRAPYSEVLEQAQKAVSLVHYVIIPGKICQINLIKLT